MVKVAVTGATGFVGRAVVAELLQRSVSPTLVVRPGTNPPYNLRTVEADLLNSEMPVLEADVLVHLAWGGLPNYHSLHHFERELPAHFQFLQRMVRSGVSRILVTGTCFEYGMQSGPLSEDLEVRPDNPYGFAKDCLRKELEFLSREVNFEIVWARLFYLYGTGQGKGSLFSQLKKAAQSGEQVFRMSGGEQLRDFLPVEEAARLLVELALGTGITGIFNVCSGRPISVRSLVEGWLQKNGWNLQLILGYYPYPDYEPMAFWGCRKKLERILR